MNIIIIFMNLETTEKASMSAKLTIVIIDLQLAKGIVLCP